MTTGLNFEDKGYVTFIDKFAKPISTYQLARTKNWHFAGLTDNPTVNSEDFSRLRPLLF